MQGITRDRVIDKIARLLTGTFSGDVHPLRTSDAGDASPRTRDDGAMLFRLYLQTKTPSARRLHYWQLRDGTIELANVRTHDDMSGLH